MFFLDCEQVTMQEMLKEYLIKGNVEKIQPLGSINSGHLICCRSYCYNCHSRRQFLIFRFLLAFVELGYFCI